MSRFPLVALLLLSGAGAARAQLDAEAAKPYQLRVALRVAKHRMFTPVFRDRLRHELHDGLQAALGPMGQVEVQDMSNPEGLEKSPLLQEVETKGLQQGLDGWHEVSDAKVHFVFVDFVDGANS